MMIEYRDRDGIPISQEGWSMLFEDQEYRRVGFFKNDTYEVSTVWLGMSHPGGMYFETMIFCPDDPEYDQGCIRYETYGEAAEGHLRTMSDLIEGRPVWFIYGTEIDEFLEGI